MSWSRIVSHSLSCQLITTCLDVIADLLKIWLRELCEPLIPMSLYESCLKVSDNRNDCVALLHQIPLVHFRTLEYLLHFLAELAKSQAVTA